MAGIATAEDNVILKTKGDLIFCDRLTYNLKTKVAICKGNVRVYSNDHIYRGDTLLYNTDTKDIQSADFRMASYPMFVAGNEIITPGFNHYRIYDGYFTTDNRTDPAFKMRAQTIEIYPNDSLVLKNIVVYVGPVPILWLPMYAQALNDDRAAYQWTAGDSGTWGAFFDNKYNWVYDERIKGTLHFDFRSLRGIGGGLDTEYKKDDFNKAIFKGYYTYDELYSQTPPPDDKNTKYRYPDINSPERYRFSLQERMQLTPETSVTADINKWSDPYVTLDFFENEYQHERQPDNNVDIVQYSEHYTISLLARVQTNGFFETVERTPELQMDFQRQKLFDTPISYEGQTSMVAFERRFANASDVTTFGTSSNIPYEQAYHANRYDTFHQFLYPKQYFNWLNLTPRIGLRGTYWSDDNREIGDTTPFTIPNDTSGTTYTKDTTNPRGRFVPDAGMEASFKVSRSWNDVQNKDLAINGLRHVAEPFINAQYVPKDFGANPNDILGFDDRLPSTRLAPLNFPDYNSIDSIGRQAVIRYGVDNKLQTKRDGQNLDLVDWATYMDFDADRNFSTTTHDNLSNVFNDIKITPLPWLALNSQLSSNIYDGRYSEYNNSISWQITRAYRVRFGNSYISHSDLFPDSDLFTLNNFYRINEHWQVETEHDFEASNGQLQQQEYTIYRDLSAWQMATTFRQRYVSDKQNDLAIYVSFTLKAFPSLDLTTNPLK